MSDEVLEVIEKVRDEISMVPETDGLCYFASNNVCFDLNNISVHSELFNIRDTALVDYDHYFVLADLDVKDKRCLIDLTYSQFLEKEGQSLQKFDRWPSSVLRDNEEGQKILLDLLKQGYTMANDDDFYLYLHSFNPNLLPVVSLEGVLPSRGRTF